MKVATSQKAVTMEAVENAVAQQRLEGLIVRQETVESMRQIASGSLTIAEGLEQVRRHYAAKIRRK